ncbi:MAG TPA: formate dehydrogenase accessory sulfurtransferase FdhD, partial [Beijerinckiaceae bacterium]|nr:formate dehydrogenase accessory sulfurtransferase FdhD [Beijerinckiaceae bacterium]
PRARRRSKGAVAIEAAAMAGALAALDGAQPLNARTRAMHAAAYADTRGVLRLVREDVGRHNALDKLIGRMMLDRLDPAQGFAVITSRCSFEMVEKAAAAGFGTLVAISAPTSLAIERAQAHGLSLVALARADYAMAFASADASS